MQNEWSWVWGACGIGGAGKSDKVITGGASKALPERCKQKIRRLKNSGFQLVEKVCFFKKVLVLNPYPQTPSPWEGAILLGLPPLDPVGGYAPATPFSENTKVYRQSEAFTFCESLLLLYKPENLKCRNSAYADNTADDIERLCAFLTDNTDKEKRYHYHRLYE